MSNLIVTVTGTTTTEATFLEDAAKGVVRFYRERSNGTTRHIEFLAEGTEQREIAEWVMGQREEGVTMKAIAAEMHVSIPTVRRLINALLLAEEIEDMEDEDIADILSVAAVEPSTTTEAINDQPVAAEATTVAATDPAVLAFLGL